MRAIEAKLSDDHSSVTFTISTEADSLTIVLVTTIFCLLVRVLLQLPKLTRAAELAAKGGALPVATSGSGLKLATLTPAQRAELAAARTTFLAAGGVLDEHADAFLLRFLLVHDFSAAAAAPQLRATAAWRNETGAARVRAEYAAGATLAAHEPFVRMLRTIGAVVGHRSSADGDVLALMHVGSFDPASWLAVMSSEEFSAVVMRLLEFLSYRADALTMASGSLVRVALILDYEGLALKHLDPRIFVRLLPVMAWPDAHYPECLAVALAVNAPWLFSRLWAILSPAFSAALQARIQILKPADSPAAIAALAAAADLPRGFGGELERMPADVRAALGFDRLGAAELAQLFPGSGTLGGYARVR